MDDALPLHKKYNTQVSTSIIQSIWWLGIKKGIFQVLTLYSPWNDPDQEMIPKWTPKWYRQRNDPHFSSRRPQNDPQLIIGMEWYSAMKLLQVHCSVYVPESHLTFHDGLCYFSALLSLIYAPLCLLFFYLKHHFKILKSVNTTFVKFTIQGMQFWHNPGYDHLSNKIMNNRKCYVHWCYQLRFMVLLKLYTK